MSKEQKLFRKIALDRLASPESLDQLIQITSPMSWLILFAIIFALLFTMGWGFLGSIPTTVQAAGILTHSGGIYSIQSPTDGLLMSINVAPGDYVKADDVVARLSQMTYLNRLKIKQQELENLKIKTIEDDRRADEEVTEKRKYYDATIANVNLNIENTENQIKWLEEQLINKEQLFQKKLITKDNYLSTQKELDMAKLSLKEKYNEIIKIKNEINGLKQKKSLEELGKQQRIDSLELEMQSLQQDFILNSKVFSPYEGKVLDINVKEGSYISTGRPMISLEKIGAGRSNLKAILYVNSYEAKNIDVGMVVNISPAHVKKEEFGSMLGIVTYVGTYPATSSSMMKELDNEALVQTLSASGAPYRFEVVLLPDQNTVNGFKWTTRNGYPHKLASGTLCSGLVVVKQQKPIELVVPLFKKLIQGSDNAQK